MICFPIIPPTRRSFRGTGAFWVVLYFLWGSCVLFGQIEENLEPEDEPAYESMRLLANAIQLIRQEYVDEDKIDFKELSYSALRGMLSELDPHSQFLDPTGFESLQEDTRSEFGGLGIQVGVRDSMLTIISPMEGTPAFDAGLMPGDRILKINGQTTDRLTLPDAVDMLRGKIGEKVTLTIQRPSTREIRDYTLQRAVIKVKSVREARILPGNLTGNRRIGYVRLNQFSEPTVKELDAALNRLEEEKMEGLILDLRYNPGGLLGSAVDVCAQFLKPETEVVSTIGRSPGRPYSTSEKASRNREVPLVILINGASASGAEIVAGALKDLGRAVLVGETTFGKGSVQSVISLPDGSAIRLTTAKYLTPGKQPIHEVGVSPHIRVVLSPTEERAVLRSRRAGDSPYTKKSDLPPDPQLERAIDLLQGVLIGTERLASAKKSGG